MKKNRIEKLVHAITYNTTTNNDNNNKVSG